MSNLAIKGGEKYRKKSFTNWPIFDEREIINVTNVIKSGKWWRFAYGEGVELKEKSSGSDRSQGVFFQEEFAKYQDVKYGLACVNGTGALEIALKAVGVGPQEMRLLFLLTPILEAPQACFR